MPRAGRKRPVTSKTFRLGRSGAGRKRPVTSKTFRLGRSGKSATLSGDVDGGFDRLTPAVSGPNFEGPKRPRLSVRVEEVT